jgi:riboflavin kinase / FMN adenylyltransferase
MQVITPSHHLIRSLDSFPTRWRGGVLSIGNFDGVHRGHRALIQRVRSMATSLTAPAMVFTFDPPPLRLLRPDVSPAPLTWMDRRAELLHRLGVDMSIAYPTCLELLKLDAVSFFERVLVGELGIRGLVEGPNFRFGKDRKGDVGLLETLCRRHGMEFEVVEAEMDGDLWYSSSLIREWIERGEIQRANAALVEPYRLLGIVGHGAARGRTLGFPTANLEQLPVLVPAHGVYAAKVVGASKSIDTLGIAAAVHIGPNPTFGEHATKVEAHLIGFHGDLYGQALELEIHGRVREVQRFASKEALLAQLQSDIESVSRTVALAASSM